MIFEMVFQMVFVPNICTVWEHQQNNFVTLREQQQKTFPTFSGFWLLRGWWGGGLSESVKKGIFRTKICFSEWSFKIFLKIISAVALQQEVKDLVGVSYKCL